MKKNIVALAVASAIAAPVAMADAPTVYGQMNMAVEQFSVDDYNGDTDKAASGTKVNSIASRLGVKGSSDLGNGLKAVYKVEFGLTPDGKDAMTNRNQYVGLAGGFGTVLMGRHDTPLKMSQPKDFFNDGTADFKSLTGKMGLGNSGENRLSNVLAYVSPSFGGVKLVAALSPQENHNGPEAGDLTAADDGVNPNTYGDNSSLTDIYSLAVMYGSKKEGLYLAAAMDSASTEYTKNRAEDAKDGDQTHVRISAQYAMGGLIANAMYQDFSGDNIKDSAREGSTLTGGVAYKFGKFMPKLAVTQVSRDASGAEDSMNYALGVNYSMGKKTTLYADYSMVEHNGSTSYYDSAESTTEYQTISNAADGSDAKESVFSVGLLHKF